jgi:hypothetical protein
MRNQKDPRFASQPRKTFEKLKVRFFKPQKEIKFCFDASQRQFKKSFCKDNFTTKFSQKYNDSTSQTLAVTITYTMRRVFLENDLTNFVRNFADTHSGWWRFLQICQFSIAKKLQPSQLSIFFQKKLSKFKI